MTLTGDKPFFFLVSIVLILFGLFQISTNSRFVLSGVVAILAGIGILITYFRERKKFYTVKELKEMILSGFKNMRLFSLKTFILILVFVFLIGLIIQTNIENSPPDYNLSNQEFIKKQEDYLNSKIGFQYNDSTECELLDSSDLKNTCHLVSAYYQGNPGLCEKTSGYTKNNCYFVMGLETLTKDLCYNISSDGFTDRFIQNSCFTGIAVSTGDLTLCDEISTESYRYSETRDYCYRLVAIEINDSSICDQINDSEEKAKCQSSFWPF
mgnify:CR=1 FL=1